MPVRLRKRKSLVNKNILSGQYTFKCAEKCLKENLDIVKDSHIFRYKFFVSYGYDEFKNKEIKTVYFVRNGMILKGISEEETSPHGIFPYNIVLYLEDIGIENIQTDKNIFEKLKF